MQRRFMRCISRADSPSRAAESREALTGALPLNADAGMLPGVVAPGVGPPVGGVPPRLRPSSEPERPTPPGPADTPRSPAPPSEADAVTPPLPTDASAPTPPRDAEAVAAERPPLPPPPAPPTEAPAHPTE